MSNFDKNKYDSEYKKTHYKDVKIRLKFNEYDKIKNYCDDFNVSMYNLAKMCLKYCIDNVHIDELKRYK